jgi:hypothetical protein
MAWPYRFQLSKYDPQQRGTDYWLREDEWSGRRDIGAAFGGQVLTEDEYLETENRYLYAVEQVFSEVGADAVTVRWLTSPPVPPADWRDLEEGSVLPVSRALDLARLVLRQDLDARLEVPDRVAVDVGDYLLVYVLSETPLPAARAEAERVGLFVGPDVSSPRQLWIEDPDEPVHPGFAPGDPLVRVLSANDPDGEDPERRVGAWRYPESAVPALRDLLVTVPGDDDLLHDYRVTDRIRDAVGEILGVRLDPKLIYWLETMTEAPPDEVFWTDLAAFPR